MFLLDQHRYAGVECSLSINTVGKFVLVDLFTHTPKLNRKWTVTERETLFCIDLLIFTFMNVYHCTLSLSERNKSKVVLNDALYIMHSYMHNEPCVYELYKVVNFVIQHQSPPPLHKEICDS